MSNGQRIVFVSGLSGSGKTTAMAALEDLGFYCADNLPAQLIEQFLDLCARPPPIESRSPWPSTPGRRTSCAAFPAVVEDLRRSGAAVEWSSSSIAPTRPW